MNLFSVVAYATEAAGQAGQTEGELTVMQQAMAWVIQLAPLIIMIALFWFLLIRPQRKRDKETKAMLDALKVGDKVVTIGGICGKVSKIKDSYVFIETGNIGTQEAKSVIKMERAAIKSVESKITN